ncbi:SUKH-4 family immunity protein [Nocardia sp. CA-107356]|uniref:SUKH-4 family immunity protein n=1 Tax=Nocardia sp. CA-107356 TaxID=3239972 RepID=UPI003D923D17
MEGFGAVKDVSVEEIRRIWDGRLEPVSSDLSPANLPSATRDFLTSVGLPTTEVLDITFIHGERLATPLQRGDRNYLVFAENINDAIFVVDLDSEYVYRTDKGRDAYTDFYNSNLKFFVYFHGLLQNNVLSLEEVTQQLVANAVNVVWNLLEEMDPRALEHDTPWNWTLSDLSVAVEADWDAEPE